MKHNKLIGITLVVASLLLQVGFAANVVINGNDTVVHPSTNMDIFFEEVKITATQGLIVDTSVPEGQSVFQVNVGNLAPGENFTVNAVMKNKSNVTAIISDIGIRTNVESDEVGTILLDGLEGKIGAQSVLGVEEYSKALATNLKSKMIAPGGEQVFEFNLGMNRDVTDVRLQGLENVSFTIYMNFVQYVPPVTPDGGGETGRPVPPIEIPEEVIPGGDIPKETIDETIVDEEIPGGEVIIPGDEVNLEDELLPGGEALPKTGGVTPMLVYGLGIALLGSGVSLYRKKEDQE